MTAAGNRAPDRPRPGPIRLLTAAVAGGLLVVIVFGVFLALEWRNAAAAFLLLPPLGELALRRSRIGAYVARHTGLEASNYTLTALWAAGLAAVFAGNPTPGPVWIAAAAGAMATLAAAAERVVWARFPSQLAGKHLPSVDRKQREFRWFDRSSGPYLKLELALAVLAIVAQLLATTLLVGDPATGVAVGVAAVFIGLLALRAAGAAATALHRARRGDAALRTPIAEDVIAHEPAILIHFSGSIHTVYQLDQWMPYILSSGHSTLLVVREQATFDAVADRWPLPVVLIGEFPDLDLVVPPSAGLALYVNTGTKNNQLIRFSNLLHVQLHHGESDKPPSFGKTLRLYDHHIVAGEAAVDRLVAGGLVLSAARVSIVGRPVTDGLATARPANDKPTVLYAPTWESYHVDSALSSVGSMGLDIIKRMPAGIDLVVRLHPLTGSVDRRLRPIVQSLRQAVAERGSSGLFVDTAAGPDLIDCMQRADLLICDVSSVLVDFLAADRPIAVCDVSSLGAAELHRRYPSTIGAAVLSPDLEDFAGLLRTALEQDPGRDSRLRSRDQLLAIVGAAEQAFHDTIDQLLRPGADR